MTFLALCSFFAVAADIDVERAHLALDRGAPDVARNYLVDLLAQQLAPDPEAVDLYLDALVAVGLGHQADSVTALVGTTPFMADAERLLAATDDAGRATFAHVLAERHPKRPDLLWPLFDGPVPGPEVDKERKRAIRAAFASAAKAEKIGDAVWLYRIRRLLIAANVDCFEMDDALVRLGEAKPPASHHWSAIAISDAATALAQGTGETLPSAPPDALLAIVRRAADLRTKARFVDGAARLWSALREETDSAKAATAHSLILLDLERLTEAATAADIAIRLSVLPTANDVAVVNVAQRSSDLIEALSARAHVRKSLGDWESARVDLHLASALAGELIDTQLAEQLDRGLVPNIAILKKELAARKGAPIELLIGDAEVALAKSDRAGVNRAVSSALLLSASLGSMSELTSIQVAHAVAFRAAAAERTGDAISALVDWSLGVWMPVTKPPLEWAVSRARALEASGSKDAAFEAWSTVRAQGGIVDDSVLAADWMGLGDWRAAADRPVVVVDADSPAVTPVLDWMGVAARKDLSRAVEKGKAGPSWRVTTPHGTLDATSMRGRVVVLSFWSSSCGTCLAALPEMGSAVRALRETGRDAVLVGVSLDTDQVAFDEIARLGNRWGVLARDPELAAEIGVGRLPTTWVIDRNGIARYRLETWVGRDAFSRLLERAATD